MDGENTGGKDEETPQTAGSQQIPHDRLHTGLADECCVEHYQRGILARAKISSQSGDGEHGHSAML